MALELMLIIKNRKRSFSQYFFAGLFLLFTTFFLGSRLCFSADAAADHVSPAQELKGIFLGKSFLFETRRDIKRVAVGDAAIAGVRALSTRQILVKGMSPGRTNLIIWHNNESVEFFDFKVEIDPNMIADAEKLIKELVPSGRVRIIPANQELLLEGEVESLEDMHRVLQITTAFFSYKKKKKGEKGEEGKVAETINIGSGKDSSDEGESESQLEQNLDLAVALKNNLIVLKGWQQVQLQVKMAEVSRSNMRKMGLSFLNNRDWSVGVFPTGTASGSITGGAPLREETNIDIINQSISQKISGGDVLESAAEIASPFGAAFQVLLHSVKDDSLALLSVLKGQGLARLLATPTLVAMSGQTARFNVGGEFPVPATDSEGSTNIDYKEYGVLLEFTPTVIGKETISLKVAPQVSSPDWTIGTTAGGVSVPGVKSRTASTTLRLKDGQTFVMAGLLKEESHVVTNKIPFLGDIPIMGTLFTSKEVEKNETELVIIVTPRLVKPLNKNEVAALPGDLIQDNISDLDFFFFNKTHNKMRPKEPEKKSRPGFEGQLGFAR